MPKTRYTLHQIVSGIIVPVLVLALALAAYFLLLPKYKAVRETRGKLSVKEQEVEARRQDLGTVNGLITEFEKKSADIQKVQGFLPAAAEVPDLLANFDSLTKQSGLAVASLDITTATSLANAQAGQGTGKYKILQEIISKTEGLGVLEINLAVTGRYPNLKGFLLNLEQNQRLMDIQLLSFTEPDGDSKIQQYSLKIYTYYQRE